MKQFFLLSDDRRFDFLSERLRFHGYPVFRSLPGVIPENSVLVFPLSAKEGDVLPVIQKAPSGTAVTVGRRTDALSRFSEENRIQLIPLLENENYLSRNAVATAEGFLAECIKETDVTLSDLTVLVIGYGNCGKAIAKLLFLCGAEVYVHSHPGSMKKAEEDGFSVFSSFSQRLSMFDCIVNTVPTSIFDKGFFSLCRPGARFFQIASGLSGIDPVLAEKEGVLFLPLPALPAKYSPASEGDEIFAALDAQLSLSHPTRK